MTRRPLWLRLKRLGTTKTSCLGGVLLLISLLSACSPTSEPPDHTQANFHNNYPGREPHWRDLVGWAWDRLTGPTIVHNDNAVPWQPVDPKLFNTRHDGIRVTWLGHASVLIEMADKRLLTDPFFSQRASPVQWLGPKRHKALPIAVEKLPHIDAVLISHNHHDHLDPASLLALQKQSGGPPTFFVPAGDGPWLRALGLSQVIEQRWWQSTTLDGLRLHFVPVQHWSRHFMERSRNESLWGGYVLDDGQQKLLFAGDTGYSKDFLDIRQRLGTMDVALLPIGAYLPRPLTQRQHISPDEAVKIAIDVGARVSLPVHWGTLVLSNERIEQPPEDLLKARQAAGMAAHRFPLWGIGESVVISAKAR